MKHLILISFVTLFIFGCQKDFDSNDSSYLETAKQALKDSLNAIDYAALDFSKAARMRVDSVAFYALRVPFKGKVAEEEFVFIRTNVDGTIKRGKIVQLEGKVKEEKTGTISRKRWDGTISLTDLNRSNFFTSPIVNGYITALHQQNSYRSALQAPQEDVMPEVIITYVKTADSGFSWSSWFYLQSFFANGDSGGGYYGSFSGGGGSGSGGGDPWSGGGNGGGGGSSTNGGGSNDDPVILVDIETQDVNSPIDVQKFINCFNAIPDGGSTCSIEIMADIPVDSDPNKIFNFDSKSPGHTFLNIRKSNGSQSVSQNIGFYPASGWKTILTNAPIDGKFVDNGQHEFNAGFKLNITPAQLQSALMEMLRSRNSKYDIDNYNCTDWALDVFNAAGGNLQIPLYDIPGNYPSTGTRTPSGVYNKLKEMRSSNNPRAGGIDMGFSKAFAGTSTGPCN